MHSLSTPDAFIGYILPVDSLTMLAIRDYIDLISLNLKFHTETLADPYILIFNAIEMCHMF